MKHIKNGKYTAYRYVKHSNRSKIWGIEYRCQGRTPHPIYNTIHAQPRPKIVGHWHAYRYLKYNEKAKHFFRRYMKHNTTIETQGVQALGIYQEKQNTGYLGTWNTSKEAKHRVCRHALQPEASAVWSHLARAQPFGKTRITVQMFV